MIKKSTTGLVERPEAILSELRFSKEKKQDRLLLVEGSTDVKVIKKYLIEKRPEVSIRVLESKEYTESDSDDLENTSAVSGKNNALNLFNKLNAQGRNVKCLLDRDWDLLTKRLQTDENIFFYDYYELENYLLEENILRKYLNVIIDSELTIEELYDLVFFELNSIQNTAKCLLKVHFLKELDVIHDFLSSDIKESVFEISKTKLAPILSRPDIPGENYLEKISYCTSDALNRLSCSHSDLDNWLDESIGFQFPIFSSPTDAFKYCIKGKDIPSIMYSVAQKIVKDNNEQIKFISALNNHAKHFLYVDWIQNDSVKFSKLISDIIDSFENAS